MAAVATPSRSSSNTNTIALAAGAAGVVALLGAAAFLARQRKEKKAKEAKEAKIAVPASLTLTRPSGPNARIAAIASAFPPNQYAQSQYLKAFLSNHPGITPADQDFTNRVFAGTGFDTCSSYLSEDRLFKKMTRMEYVKYVKDSLFDMAIRSSKDVIAQWGGDKKSITHIVFGTMTGTIHAPTMDIQVAIDLDLAPGIKRLNVEGMGCLTGYRCLGLANDIARSDTNNVVLLIVCDIRSALGNQLPPYAAGDKSFKSNVIVSSLFRDSGAAAIVTSEKLGKRYPAPESKASSAPLYEIIEHRSALIPGTFNLVKYHEKDDAVIFLDISKDLPETIKKVLKPEVEGLLRPYGLKIEDCTYSVHTGGPKVLNYVAESLGVSKGRMASSWYCMKKWGNLSGSSNLVVLDHWRRLPATVGADIVPESRQNVVCMSFGPGVGMELILLRVRSPEVGATDFQAEA